MADTRGAVLISGATGFLGAEIIGRYLRETDRRMIAIIRGADQSDAERRLDSILEQLFGAPASGLQTGRIRAVRGDLRQERLGLEADRYEGLAGEVSEIVHSAASVSFDLPLAEAREINVDGTHRMLELAECCRDRGGLRRYCQVSTAYVAGDHRGEFREDQLDVGQSFRNSYEQSKFEAERLVADRGAGLPTVVVRPSIIVGESATGWTSSFNVLYPPLKAFSRGAYPAIPARRSTPVDIVPVDYVAAAVVEVCQREGTAGTYHLVSGRAATTVGRLLDRAGAYFGRRPPTLVPPALYERVLYPLLVHTGGRHRRRALRRSKALFPYFSMQVRFDDARARSALAGAGVVVAAPESYFERLLSFAVLANWGKRQPDRHEAWWRRRVSSGRG